MRRERPQWQRDALRRLSYIAAIGLVGLVLELLLEGTASLIGTTLLGLAGVLLVALVFLEIGYSEDRERTGG